MSFLQTIIKINLVITLAGGMVVGLESAWSSAVFGCSSAVELDPSFDSTGPPSCPPPFTADLFPKLNSSRPNSSKSKNFSKKLHKEDSFR